MSMTTTLTAAGYLTTLNKAVTARATRIAATVAAYPSNRLNAPLDIDEMASPPTVATSTIDVTTISIAGDIPFTRTFPYNTAGNSALYATNWGPIIAGSTYAIAAGRCTFEGTQVPFMTDVSFKISRRKVAIRFTPTYTTKVRFKVTEFIAGVAQPERYVSKAGTTLAGGGTYNFVLLTFATDGERIIAVECAGATGSYVCLQPMDNLTAPPIAQKLVVTLDMDSYGAGVQGLYTEGVQFGQDGIPGYIRDYLNCTVNNISTPGSGWQYTNANTVAPLNDAIRVSRIPLNTDVLICEGCINEVLFNQVNISTLQSAVMAALVLRRARLPGVPIIVIGTIQQGATNGAAHLAAENAVLAAIAALADPLIFAVPTMQAPNVWITGKGSTPRLASGMITFNAPLSAATSGTMAGLVPVLSASDYRLVFSDGTTHNCTGNTPTNVSLSVTWTGAVTDAAANPVAYYYSLAGAGNQDFIIGEDFVHPKKPFGCQFIGLKITDALISVLGRISNI
ncbi:hypothetical protein [Janthinobacterium sp. CG_S6]|uniref:hypothetical protein n=1 Tax=Janthinobacterium sp. CG_S6 TaxID=3071707 RepID=UPI002E066B40|nr:hypothetical protein [Janthinobacterium sp. CG_S6]